MSLFADLVVGSPPGGPVEIGVDETQQVHSAGITNNHWTVGGLTGFGKSEFLRFVIKQLAVREHTALLLGDGKMDEFPAWQPRASCLALGPQAMRQMIDWLADEVVRRYAALVDLEHWMPRTFRIGVDGPQIVAVLDEVHTTFYGSSKEVGAFVDRFHEIITMARAVGVTVIMCTQNPKGDSIPTKIRDNTTIQIGFRTRDGVHTDMIFGNQQVPAHKNLGLPGQMYAQMPGMTSPGHIRLRGPRDPKESILDVREATKHLRVPLDGLPHVILHPLLEPTPPQEATK